MDTTTLIKERPILFSGPMVQAILNGSKTQTRRVVKNIEFDADLLDGVYTFNPPKSYKGNGFAYAKNPASSTLLLATCPYGQPGDRLWVRETLFWSQCDDGWCYQAGNEPVMLEEYTAPILLKEKPAIPSIHMPREASRLLLEITSVRVERLQAISHDDAVAEGIEPYEAGALCYRHYTSERATRIGSVAATRTDYVPAIESFQSLWQSINGPDSWQANPWVWVVSFKVIQKGGGSCA